MKRAALVWVSVVLAGGALHEARAWTAPLEISASSANERSTPRIARGAVTGNFYVVYVNKSSPWQCCFRQRSAAGDWGAVEVISGAQFATRMELAEDGQGRPHVMYASYNTSGSLDLVHAYRNAGSWISTYVGATSAYEDQPHMAVDAGGRIHVVFTRTSSESSAGDVVYRSWNAGAWGAEIVIGHTDQSYYRRPDVCVDPVDNLHVVWGDKSGSVYKIRYRKFDGTAWSVMQDVGSSTAFPSYAKIAALSVDYLLVVWDDANITYNHSGNGGAAWAFGLSGSVQGQVLSSDRSPAMDGGAGLAHLITTTAPSFHGVGYRQWNGTAWSAPQNVYSDAYWKGWPDVAADAGGTVHAVWDEVYGGGDTWEHYIAYSTSAADTLPPGAVIGFTAAANHNFVALGWTNPSDPDYQRTIVRVSTTGYPASPTDGSPLADRPNTPGSTDGCTHASVVNGTRYYYAAFARDSNGLYAAAATATARPFVPPDIDRDGDVDQSDFGVMQRCLSGPFVAQADADCQGALLDNDTDVDDDDIAAFVACMSGAGMAYVPTCAD